MMLLLQLLFTTNENFYVTYKQHKKIMYAEFWYILYELLLSL